MRCDELKELIQLAAVGQLDPAEDRAVRDHLEAGCPRCAAEAAAAAGTLGLLPYALSAEEPSPMVKTRLMDSVRRAAGPARPGPATAPAGVARPSWRFAAAASLAAALVTGSATGYFMLRRQERIVAVYESRNAELAARIAKQQTDLETLARQVREAQQSIQLVSSPLVKVVTLAGQGERAAQAARVFWDPARETWQLYASNLPAAPAGRAYQLWLITDAGAKISAGTFAAGGESAAMGRVELPPGAGRAVAAAVTLEPAGGSPQPTTQPFLVGSI